MTASSQLGHKYEFSTKITKRIDHSKETPTVTQRKDDSGETNVTVIWYLPIDCDAFEWRREGLGEEWVTYYRLKGGNETLGV